MGTGRIPGPYGSRVQFGCVLYPDGLGLDPDPWGEFPHVTPGPFGTNGDRAAQLAGAQNAAAAADEDELKLLVKVYGMVKNKAGNKSYAYKEKGNWKYRVADYAADRNAYFGSQADYDTYRATARAELDSDEEKLRKFIEPNADTRKKFTDWKDAQDVFYAWIRKAYQKELGDKTDIPKLINSQMSEKLKTALSKVKVDYGKEFQYGGFNPRPMKLDGYRLGTISEHALGTAVDVESGKNAHIEVATWSAIQTFTGKALSHSTAQSKWKTAPKELYDSIKAINDEFVSKIDKAVKDTEEAAQKAAEAPGATDAAKATLVTVKKDPLAAAIEGNDALKKVGASFINDWYKKQKGFFSLPWELVKEFQDEGFLWGATFSHPDLHHFEL